MINSWDYRQFAVVEADDMQDRWDRNGMNFLFYWRSKFPEFKITLFTIPERTNPVMLRLLDQHKDWIELAVHGWNHESNFECYDWDYDRTMRFMERAERFGYYKKIFKAPGWSIIPGYNGYPASEKSLITKDPQAVYKALNERGYWIVDRHYNAPGRPEGTKVICIDDQDLIVHMHTWNMETGDPAGRNGYQQVIEEHGEPWDDRTKFYFISEMIEKGMVAPCQK